MLDTLKLLPAYPAAEKKGNSSYRAEGSLGFRVLGLGFRVGLVEGLRCARSGDFGFRGHRPCQLATLSKYLNEVVLSY